MLPWCAHPSLVAHRHKEAARFLVLKSSVDSLGTIPQNLKARRRSMNLHVQRRFHHPYKVWSNTHPAPDFPLPSLSMSRCPQKNAESHFFCGSVFRLCGLWLRRRLQGAPNRNIPNSCKNSGLYIRNPKHLNSIP